MELGTEVPEGEQGLKKVVLIATLLGFLVATSIGLPGLYSYHHGDRTSASKLATTITICVWPTVVGLIDADDNATGYIAFAISAVANGILYGLVALGAALVWKYVLTPEGRRERAQAWWPSNRRDQ
jgi:hypothetical protein